MGHDERHRVPTAHRVPSGEPIGAEPALKPRDACHQCEKTTTAYPASSPVMRPALVTQSPKPMIDGVLRHHSPMQTTAPSAMKASATSAGSPPRPRAPAGSRRCAIRGPRSGPRGGGRRRRRGGCGHAHTMQGKNPRILCETSADTMRSMMTCREAAQGAASEQANIIGRWATVLAPAAPALPAPPR